VSGNIITNIPTELLRTLVTVVDLRSFTKAANALGVTQPAVSAQIKRLQFLLDADLFDKSAPGVALTEQGELVVNYARRMLAINDQILSLVSPHPSPPALRVGVPGDFGAGVLPVTIAKFQARAPHIRIHLRGDTSENLLRDLRQGQLDLAMALTIAGPALDARRYWREESVWIRGPTTRFDPGGRVPVVTLREGSFMHRVTTSILNQAGREYEVVFIASSLGAVLAAVAAGLGLSLLSRRDAGAGVEICEPGLLPQVPDVYCGIYLREGVASGMLHELADAMAAALKPSSEDAAGREVQSPSATRR
jgi:DNA-binding transcriptional LysR family regulator